MLPAPGFHHLHLNSVDPNAAIDFYARQFPSSSKASWGGLPALKAPISTPGSPSREALELVEVKELDDPQNPAV